MIPRGIRLNNPGNIRRDHTSWLGLADQQTDPDFWEFSTPEYGIRAIVKIMQSYRRERICTIASAINRWAPPVENNTQAYIDAVATSVGVDSGHIVDLNNVMQPLVKAIIQHENGQNPYTDAVINEGIALA